MGTRFAEVIGDPVAHSKSPIIHKYWLETLGIDGDYLRTQVAAGELAGFLDDRRADLGWRGCNVTIPHKEHVVRLLDRVDAGAQAIGAVNCVTRESGLLVGYNTDIDGVAAALESTELEGRNAALIGAGGGARAVVACLANRGVACLTIIARSAERAEALRAIASDMLVVPFDRAEEACRDSRAIINASPLGMVGANPMPRSLLDAVRKHAAGATIFDLVTTPAETEFLAAGRLGGGLPVDGLTMLVGQARRAFELFFGAPPPTATGRLRELLTTSEEAK